MVMVDLDRAGLCVFGEFELILSLSKGLALTGGFSFQLKTYPRTTSIILLIILTVGYNCLNS
jgi:hypothetical protein